MIERVIVSEACVAEGAAYLAALEPRFADALAQTGALPLRLKPDGFEALLDTIVSQQLSVAAAKSIWKRLEIAGLTSPSKIIAASQDELRGCGLSRPKIKYAKSLAETGLDYVSLRDHPTQEVISKLIEIKGIGRWTAEIYAMFSLGRADVFAPADLALQEAVRVLFDLEERPSEKALGVMAQDWTPWRGVAARLLWSYYHVVKNKEGLKS